MIINIFKRGHKQLNSGIDTWIVEWTRRYGQFSGDTEQCYQAFTSKEEANELLTNGFNDEAYEVRPKWPDGTPAHTIKSFGICNKYDLRKEFPIPAYTEVHN